MRWRWCVADPCLWATSVLRLSTISVRSSSPRCSSTRATRRSDRAIALFTTCCGWGQHGGGVARKNRFYSAYGAKVIVSPDLPEDPALMSRCILLPMTETKTVNLRPVSDPKVQEFARQLQKC